MKELSDYPPLMLISEAAEFLRLSNDTVVEYGKQGRITIQGSHTGQRVVRKSIRDYLEGTSLWHEKRKLSDRPGADPTPALSATGPHARRRGKPSGRTPMASGNIVTLRTDRKLRSG